MCVTCQKKEKNKMQGKKLAINYLNVFFKIKQTFGRAFENEFSRPTETSSGHEPNEEFHHKKNYI